MPFSMTKLALALALSAAVSTINAAPALEPRTLTKANEYRTSDCSGPMNFHHRPGWGGFLNLDCTNMDNTTHSVYLNSGTLGAGYKAYNARDCRGDPLGATGHSPYLQGLNGKNPCVDLDRLLVPEGNTAVDSSLYRIGSIRYIEAGTPQDI
ncbi:hypothetical protein MMC16_007361 [Acarospora aff. strigata]|nr:hypothetical protein [Acarospora aff. strigata]